MFEQLWKRSKVNLRKIYTLLIGFGFDPIKAFRVLFAFPGYICEYRLFRKMSDTDFLKISFYPCLNDRYDNSGSASGHYFHQDLLVAQKIFKAKPQRHVDIGSRIDGFVAHIASFREIEVFDIRPNNIKINNIKFKQLDLMSPIPAEWHNYCDSVSCLHAIEHFGLGRYGDPLAPGGFRDGLRSLFELCRPGGKVYLSLPIGSQRVEFNAHRVFSTKYLFDYLRPEYEVESFSYVDDKGKLHSDVTVTPNEVAYNFGCEFGCGIFELTKRGAGNSSTVMRST